MTRARLANSSTPRTADRYDMEMAFSRGLYTGWFRGTNNQATGPRAGSARSAACISAK